MTLKSKVVNGTLIEVKQENGYYALYVGGSTKTTSSDLNYIISEYDKYVSTSIF